MAVRSGRQYLDALRDGREVWLQGIRVADVTREPGLERGARTLAEFIDRQHDAAMREKLTFVEDGERHPMSFLLPRREEDVRRRGAACYEWAKWSNGMLGRTPDYKNASLTAFAGACGLPEREWRGRGLRRQHARLLRGSEEP